MRNIFFFLLLSMFTLTACSSHSVKHLNRQVWTGGVPQTLKMKYWTFKYTTLFDPDNLFQVTGTAYPQKANIPSWGRWLRTLDLAVYLCDDKGNVLTSQHQAAPAQNIPYKKGVPFSFRLDKKQLHQVRPLFVTFGYRMKIAKARYSRVGKFDSELSGDGDEVFFASQGSMLN